MDIISKKHKKIAVTALVIASIFCVYFSVICTIIERIIDKEKTNAIIEIATSQAYGANKMFGQYFQTLDVIAQSLMVRDFPQSSSNVTTLRQLMGRTDFKSVGVYFLDGSEYATDNLVPTSTSREYFATSLAGEPLLSPALPDDIDGESVNYLTSPIYFNKLVIGVIYAKISSQTLAANVTSYTTSYTTSYRDTKIYFVDRTMRSMSMFDNLEAINIYNELGPKNQINITYKIRGGDFAGHAVHNKKTLLYITPVGSSNLFVLATVPTNNAPLASRKIANLALATMLVTYIAFAAIICVSNARNIKNRMRIGKTTLELETIMSDIPGGVIRFSYDVNLSLLFVNDSMLSITEYRSQELFSLLSNSFSNFIHNDDRTRLMKLIFKQSIDRLPIEADCRIIKKNGSFTWFMFRGKVVEDNNGDKSCLCVLTDINNMKKTEYELNQTMQRYAIIISQSDSIIFEYNFDDNSVYLSNHWNDKFAIAPFTPNFTHSAVESGLILKQDAVLLNQMFERIKNGLTFDCLDIKLRNKHGDLIWCKIRSSAIFDVDGKVYKTVGKIIDIDSQYREKELLKQKAELDSLTGVYNKGATKLVIESYLAQYNGDMLHAILIIDVDNFKGINDSLGHLTGDKVLVELTARMTALLRSSDICGRIGGDEFAILLCDFTSVEEIRHKANSICKAVNNPISSVDNPLSVSCSIGVAICDNVCNVYDDLIQKADIALYESKKCGKNCIMIYGEW